MKNTYYDLIRQTFDFPQDGFDVKDNWLLFNDIPLKELVEEYGTPLRLTYLPRIRQQIEKARHWFRSNMEKHSYNGKYYYCYCTKSSHFAHVMDAVTSTGCHLETSSAYDIDIIERLYLSKKIDKDTFIISNGYKTDIYTQRIAKMINLGFNMLPVLDNMEELNNYEETVIDTCNLGIRIAAEEQPDFQLYTSRLGIRYSEIKGFYEERIKPNKKFKLKMLHFFINSGIRDNIYYWNELTKSLKVYCELKKVCKDLTALNIGGGFPARNSLGFEYDYEYIVEEIILKVKETCEAEGVPVPDIFTEFGSFTVAESGAHIFSVLGEKQQNDSERWYMIDNSLMTTMPDAWGINSRFILLPLNNWDGELIRANIGGLSCDQMDYYNSEAHTNELYLPRIPEGGRLYIGFFHTGAYQESISGYGGIKHCLIPSPRHLLVDHDENGKAKISEFAPQQQVQSMMDILGY